MARLSVNNLHIERGNKVLCQGLTHHFNPGECWALLGSNGAGKSTLLHTLAGLDKNTRGSIELSGTPLATYSRQGIARKMALLIQQQTPDMTGASVLASVLMGRHPHIRSWQWETTEDLQIAFEALYDTDLANYSDRTIDTLSGGERQRLAIATVLCQTPEIFLLDEPTNNLDIPHQIRTLKHFQRLSAQGKLVIMALHDLNLAIRFCTHALVMLPGGEYELGDIGAVLTEETLTRAYQHPIRCVKTQQQVLFVADEN